MSDSLEAELPLTSQTPSLDESRSLTSSSGQYEPASSAAPASGWRSFFLTSDELLEGRRLRLLLGAVLYQSVLAPALDRALKSVRDVSAVAELARSAGHISYAGFQFFSLLGALGTLLVFSLVLGGRLATMATESREQSRAEALRELRMLLLTELRLLQARPLFERMAALGFAAYTVAITARDMSRLVRWVAWEGPLKFLGLEETFLATPFEWMYSIENVLEVVSLGSILLTALGLASWINRRPLPQDLATMKNPRALLAATRAIQVQDVPARSNASALFHGSVVSRCLDTLAAWQPQSPLASEKDVQLALYEHLRQSGFAVGFEEQLGNRQRIDLTVDGSIAIELKFGKLSANERNRVIGQCTIYADRWAGRGPLFVICVGAAPEKVEEVAQRATAWNRQMVEKSTGASPLSAPILVLAQVGEPSASGA